MLFEKLTEKQFIYEEVPLNKITIEEEDRVKPPAFLARNIKKLGLIHDVLLYKNGESYHVLTGRKRVLSLKKSRVKTIPAKVLSEKPNNAEIALILLSENFIRKPSPAQEAQQIKNLIESGYSIEEIHKTTGIPIRMLKARLKLLKLNQEWFEKLQKGEITLSKALKIAKLPEAAQKKLSGEKTKTITEIENQLRTTRLQPIEQIELNWTAPEEKPQNQKQDLTQFLIKNNLYCQVTFIPVQGTFKTIVGTKKKKVIAEDKDIITSIIKAIEKLKGR